LWFRLFEAAAFRFEDADEFPYRVARRVSFHGDAETIDFGASRAQVDMQMIWGVCECVDGISAVWFEDS
jgi:hypothetical protein